MSDMVHLNALVHGRVQGVYYRAFTSRLAKSLSLKGSVRNTAAGDVEVEAEGPKDKVEELLRQLKKGPPDAIIEKIDMKWSAYTGKYTSFDVRYLD
jgi:acylphosphatase